MKFMRVTLALLFGALFSISANAAGEPPRFQGPYAGLVSGYGFADPNFTYNGTPFDVDMAGPLAGITAGSNWNLGSFVLGIEADAQVLGLSKNTTCGGLCNVSVDADALVTARARAGWLLGSEDQFMVYATGGLGFVWLDTVNNGGAQPNETQWNETTYVVGGGFEGYVMGTDWISTKLEYLYVGANSNRNFLINTGDAGRIGFNGIHVFRWGWNIHLN